MSPTHSHNPALPDEALRKELVARAEALVPALLERVPQARAERQVPRETIADMQAAGFFRALQPKRWGGAEAHPHIFFDVARIVASACPRRRGCWAWCRCTAGSSRSSRTRRSKTCGARTRARSSRAPTCPWARCSAPRAATC
jgi:hypothetical protein